LQGPNGSSGTLQSEEKINKKIKLSDSKGEKVISKLD